MKNPNLQNNSKHIDIKRLKVNAQVTALITLIEFLGNLTLLLHLIFIESNPWSATIHSMIFFNIIGPYAFLSNNADNKNRIIDTGWKRIFKNLFGMKQESIKDSANDLNVRNNTTEESTDRSTLNSKNNQATTSETSNTSENKSVKESPSTMENENIAKHNRVTQQKLKDSLNSKSNTGSVPKKFLRTDINISIVSPPFISILTKSKLCAS